MNIPFLLLINPWIYDFAAYDLWIKPLGLLTIAACLKQKGFRVELIDCLDINYPEIQKLPSCKLPSRKETGQGQFLKQHIEKPECLKLIPRKYSRYGMLPSIFDKKLEAVAKPDAILVTSMMTYWYPGVFDCIKSVKTKFPDIPVILGGIYATLCPDHARTYSGADIVHTGAFDNKLLNTISGITRFPCYHSKIQPFIPPACELLSSKKLIPVITSKGCPFRCAYCASALLQAEFLQLNPKHVVDYIEFWHGQEGTQDFTFYDDALLINPRQHIIPMLQELLKRKISVRFHVPNGLHVRSINHELAELLKQVGFKTLRLGLETSDPEAQLKTGGKVTREEFIKAAEALKDAGFTHQEVGVYILAGMPGQSFQSVHDTVLFVQNHGLRPLIAEYSPIPGTMLWEQAVTYSPFPISDEPLFHNNTLLPCRSDDFTVEDLELLKQLSRKHLTPFGRTLKNCSRRL